jgi:hypothetical protein
MKKILVIGSFMLLAMMSFATGPALKDCNAASATVSQSTDLVIAMSAIIPEAVVFYELPFAGTIPNLVTPIESAMLSSYVADIWHPPVLSTSWLSSTNFRLMALCNLPIDVDWRCQEKVNYRLNCNKVFHICWFDIA